MFLWRVQDLNKLINYEENMIFGKLVREVAMLEDFAIHILNNLKKLNQSRS